MIVRNEETTVVPLILSLKNHINGYIVCDTGSADDTIDTIKKYFDNFGIQGLFAHHIWKNFAHNRNECLRHGESVLGQVCKYWLILDADQVFVSDENIRLPDLKLTHDAYWLIENVRGMEFQNLRLVRSSRPWFFKGIIHESIHLQDSFSEGILPRSIYTKHDSLGERSVEHDIKLLEKALQETPNDPRLVFYLAKAKHSVDMAEAVPLFIKRIQLGETPGLEEVFWSKYALGLILEQALDKHKDDRRLNAALHAANLSKQATVEFTDVLRAYEQASMDRPYRYEPWFQIASLFWFRSHNAESCYHYAMRGLKAGPIKHYTLFAHNSTIYSLHYLVCVCGSIVAYSTEQPRQSCHKIVQDLSQLRSHTPREHVMLKEAKDVLSHYSLV